MAVTNPPLFLAQRTDHQADEFRRLIKALSSDNAGVFSSGDLAVSQNGTPNMSVNVATGRCLVAGSGTGAAAGFYFIENTSAVVNVVISAANATNPRKDIIVARIQDAAYTGATNTATIEVVTGVAASSPVDPTLPDNCLALARVTVAAAATSIVTANITDLRTFTGDPDQMAWTAWSSSTGLTGGLTGVSGRYLKAGKRLYFNALLSGTATGVGVTFTLPAAASANGQQALAAISAISGKTACAFTSGGTTCEFRNGDYTIPTSGSVLNGLVSGVIEVL